MKKTSKFILLRTGTLIALGTGVICFSKHVNSKYRDKDLKKDLIEDEFDNLKNRHDKDEFLKFISCPAKAEIDELREDVENNTEEIISLWEHIEALYKSKDNIDKIIIKKDRG